MESISRSKTLIQQVKVSELSTIIASRSHTLIDVRDPKSILDQGAFPGAVQISFESINSGNEEVFTKIEQYSEVGPLLFCCTGGVMSYMAAMKVKDQGVGPVFNLEGGHSAWIKFGNEE